MPRAATGQDVRTLAHQSLDWPEAERDFGPTGFEYVWSQHAGRVRWFAPDGVAHGEMDYGRARSNADVPPFTTHGDLYNSAIETIRQYVPNCRRVLDAACGVGYGTDLLRAQGWEAVGLDIDEEALAFARARYPDSKFMHADARWIDNTADDSLKGRFDAYVSVETFEHVPIADTTLLLGEAAHLVRPGGLYIFSTPNKRPEQFWSPYHFYEYAASELAEILDWFRFAFVAQVTQHGTRPSFTRFNAETRQPLEEAHTFLCICKRLP